MAEELQQLDLDKPGKLWATVENEEVTQFFVVTPEEKYTADKLSEEPNLEEKHFLMSPFTATPKDADKEGVITLDLAASGKAKEMLQNLDARFEKGEAPPKKVKAIVLTIAKPGNKIPAKQLAEVIELELLTPHELRVTGKKRDNGVEPLYVTAAAFKKGVNDFLLELVPLGIDEIEVTTSSGKAQCWVEGGPKGTSIKLPAAGKDLKPIELHVEVLFTKSIETRQVYHPQITYAWDYWKPAYTTTDKREIFQGQEFTVDVVGKSSGAPIKKSIKVRAEAWAAGSDWMIDTSPGPPNVYYHPHC